MPSVTLAADPAAYALDAKAARNALYPDPCSMALSFPDVGMSRSFEVNLGDLTLVLNPLPQMAIVGKDGRPSQMFQHDVNKERKAIVAAFNRLRDAVVAIQTAYDAAAQASAAATEANNAAVEVRETVATVETKFEQLEAGELALPAVNVGGQRFVNNGGTFEREL